MTVQIETEDGWRGCACGGLDVRNSDNLIEICYDDGKDTELLHRHHNNSGHCHHQNLPGRNSGIEGGGNYRRGKNEKFRI